MSTETKALKTGFPAMCFRSSLTLQMMGIEGSNGNMKPLFAITNNSNGEQTYVQSQPQTMNLSNQPQIQTQPLQPSLPRPANTPTPSSQIALTTSTKTTAANNGIAVQLSQALPHGFIIQPAGTIVKCMTKTTK